MSKKNKSNHSEQNRVFKYSLIASAIMSLSATAHAAEANDQEAADEDVEVIQVTGTRRDWQSAQSLKKEAASVVDAISSEDVGVLPDRSVLEAMVRLPGVTMSRTVDGNDSEHFGTEGTGVNVRGLTFVRSAFNGRDSFSASGGGGLNFSDVPPELLGSVEVFKSPTASQLEGGIGGSVNLNTKKPFDSDKRLTAFSVDSTYSDFRDENTPSFSGLFSDVMETDDYGKFGVLLSFSDNELKMMSDSVLAQRHKQQQYDVDGDGTLDDVWVARGMRMNRKTDDRERTGGALALQWESPDQSLRLTAEYIRSNASLSWVERAIEIDAQKAEELIPVDGTVFEFDENGVFEKGTITTNEGWRGSGDYRQPSGGNFGQQLQMVSRQRDTNSQVEDFSFKAEWTPTSELAIEVDFQHIKADADVYDMSVWSAMRGVPSLDFTVDGMPTVELYSPEYNGEADHDSSEANTHFIDRDKAFLQSAMDHLANNDAEENAATFDASYQFDDGIISSVEVGVRYANREQTNRQSKYNWGYLSEAWTGGGSMWLDEQDEMKLPTDIDTLDNFGRGGILRVDGNAGILFPGMPLVADYDFAMENLATVTAGGGWVPLGQRTALNGDLIMGLYDNNEVYTIEQENTAAYFQANYDIEVGDYFVTGNFGVRYVSYTTKSDGFVKFPDHIPKDEKDANGKLPADQAAFGNDAFFTLTSEETYDAFLPSFNMKVELSEGLISRLGLSKSIALPNLGMLRNHINISGSDMIREVDEDNLDENGEPQLIAAEYARYTASAGNPALQPIESNNVDVTLEWYFADVGSLTTALFYKDIEGYFVNGTRLLAFENNGSTQLVDTSGATNAGGGSIKGFEIAYQQFYDFLPAPFNGVGMQFNYTFIDESGAPNSGLKPDFPSGDGAGDYEVAFDTLPLENVSKNNFNIVAMYENDDWQARIAYNWRSRYLITSRDVRSQSPTFNEAAGYLDASIFYQVSDNVTVGLQGSNLSNTINKTTVWLDDGSVADKGAFVVDRRISAILRATF